jgi:hypothetical protein
MSSWVTSRARRLSTWQSPPFPHRLRHAPHGNHTMKYTEPTICSVLRILAGLNLVAAMAFGAGSFSGNAALVIPATGAGGAMLLCFIASTALGLLGRIEWNTSLLVHEATKDEEVRKKNAGLFSAPLPVSPTPAKGRGFVQTERIVTESGRMEERRAREEAWQRAQRGE